MPLVNNYIFSSSSTIAKYVESSYGRVVSNVPPVIAPPGRGENQFNYVGGFYVPVSKFEEHVLNIGSTGTGKTKCMKPAIAQACSNLEPGKGLVIIFDQKGDMYPLAQTMADLKGVPLYYLNIADDRSNCLHIGADIDGYPSRAYEFNSNIFPVAEGTDPFWTTLAKSISVANTITLYKKYGTEFSFHHLYNANMASLTLMEEFMLQSPENAILIERIFKVSALETRDGIIMNLMAAMKQLEMAAAHAQHTPRDRWVSLTEILKKKGILVIALSPDSEAFSIPFMRAIFHRLSQMLISAPDLSALPKEERSYTHIFLDELYKLGKNLPGLTNLLTFSRSKGCRLYLTIQNIGNLKKNYGEDANTIIGNCRYKLFMACGDIETAEFYSRQVGETWEYRPSFSRTELNSTVSLGETRRPRMLPSEFMELPDTNPDNGMHFVFMSPRTKAVRVWIPPEEVSNLQPYVKNIPHRVEKPRFKYTFKFWNPNEDIPTAPPLSKDDFLNLATSPLERTAFSCVYEIFSSFANSYVEQLLQ